MVTPRKVSHNAVNPCIPPAAWSGYSNSRKKSSTGSVELGQAWPCEALLAPIPAGTLTVHVRIVPAHSTATARLLSLPGINSTSSLLLILLLQIYQCFR